MFLAVFLEQRRRDHIFSFKRAGKYAGIFVTAQKSYLTDRIVGGGQKFPGAAETEAGQVFLRGLSQMLIKQGKQIIPADTQIIGNI